MLPCLLKKFAGFCLLAGFLFAPRPALAQTVVLATNQIERSAADRPFTDPTWNDISYQDCLNNDVFTFPIDVENDSEDRSLQVWAGIGTDCAVYDNRLADKELCWLVGSATVQDKIDLKVPVRTIVARLKEERTVPPSNLGANVCDTSYSSSGDQVSLAFVLVTSGQNVEGATNASWETKIDLVGPKPPTDIEVGEGENQLLLSWDADNDDIERFSFFCLEVRPTAVAPRNLLQVPALGDAGVSDAGTDAGGGAAGADGAGGSGGAAAADDCSGGVLVAGQRPPTGLKPCGDSAAQSTKGNATGLENNVRYAVAIAGYDALDNFGVLSEVKCGTPKPVVDFFEHYKANGGVGGGGYCSLSTAGLHNAADSNLKLTLGALCSALALVWLRRRKAAR